MKYIIAFFCAFELFVPRLSAAEAAGSQPQRRIGPWSLFGVVSGGYSLLNADLAGELDKDGYHLDVKGLANLRKKHWSVDFGGGWFYNRLEKSGSAAPVVRELVRTRGGMAEFSPRYRYKGFEVGPIAQFFFGTDVSFSALTGKESFNAFGGLTALYRWDTKLPLRVSISALTDFTVESRQLWMILAGIHVGWNFPWERRQPATNDNGGSKKTIVKLGDSSPAKSGKRISFNSDLIFFDSNSADVRPSSKAKLLELGAFLKKRHDLWESLRVAGHTDSLGTYEYNLMLSEKRAAAVRAILVEGGIDAKDVISEGKSFSEPRTEGTSPAALRMNRRVELIFESQKDLKPLVGKIKELDLEEPLP